MNYGFTEAMNDKLHSIGSTNKLIMVGARRTKCMSVFMFVQTQATLIKSLLDF